MSVANGLLKSPVTKVQAGKMAGVRVILEADIHRVSAIIDGCFQRRQVSGRADEFHNGFQAGTGLSILVMEFAATLTVIKMA